MVFCSNRIDKGQATIELVVGLLALIPILLVIFDLTIIVLASQKNDAICREAARAASTGNPSGAEGRANAIVSNANLSSTNSLVSKFQLVKPIGESITSARAGSAVVGNVTVQTDVEVHPFIVQWAYGGRAPLKFRSQQTFPFTYVVPSP